MIVYQPIINIGNLYHQKLGKLIHTRVNDIVSTQWTGATKFDIFFSTPPLNLLFIVLTTIV